MHWACSHHALGRATQQIQDGDDGQPAGAASARSVEGVRRGQSDIWPYPMARLEVGDQVVAVEVMGSGQRSILRCEAANTAAGTSTILAK